MPDTLLKFVLHRLDQIECPVFLCRELVRFPEEELNALRAEGILRETSRATEIPRMDNLPPGEDLIVKQTSKGLYGVADEDDYFDPIPLTEDDVRQFDVSLPKLVSAIRRENGINGNGFENLGGLLPLGQKIIDGVGSTDVYFSLPIGNESRLLLHCQRLQRSGNLRKIILLTPIPVSLTPEGLRILDGDGIIVIPLTRTELTGMIAIDWQSVFGREVISFAEEYPMDSVVIERRNVGEEVHWIVNGVDKGKFYVRKDSKKAKIIEILFDQIGIGWVRHNTFMNACAWTKEKYFRSSDDPGCMQRQLTEIRNFLDVGIEFRKNRGVRFAENVVKSR